MSVVTGIKIGNTIYNVNDTSALPLSGGTMTGDIDMNSNSITDVDTPVNNDDAVNKEYVDDVIHIVEQSTSGIWTYRKWSDGTSECWGTYAISGITCTQAVGSLYRSDNSSGIQIPDFPTNLFNSVPKIFKDYQAEDSAGAFIWNYGTDSATSAGVFYLMRPVATSSSTGLDGGIYIYAIGTYTT